MKKEQKDLFGAWVQASGTTLAAIGSTPFESLEENELTSFTLIGNVLQALGNSLMADSQEDLTLGKIGNQIQAIGNLFIVAGIVVFLEEEENLDIKGNVLQAIGGTVAVSETLQKEPSNEFLYQLYGNLLQIIGNSMQAIGGILDKRGGDGGRINTAGSWIQAAGSILQAIGISKYPSS